MSKAKDRITSSVLCLAVTVCCLLCGCDQREMLRRMTPMEDYMLAREFVSQVVAGDIENAMKSLSAQTNRNEALQVLTKLSSEFKHGEIKDVEVVGLFYRAGFGAKNPGKNTTLTLQLELTTGWFVGTVVTIDEAGTRKIATGNFQSIPDSLERINGLNLMDKPLLALLFLLVVIALPLFSLYALVQCIRTPMTRKWLWIVFILFGISILRLNWTTGGMEFQLLNIQLLGASFFRSGLVGSWVFGVSFPLGAVLFLRKRRQLLAQAAAPTAPTTVLDLEAATATEAPVTRE